jgi:ribonuclease P protein component
MTGLRFPKSARLSRASEFERMRREGQSFHGKFIVLSVLKNLPSPEVRVGLITSRRVGGAVVRNRVRRRLREIVRAARPQIAPGTWLTLVARHAAARATWQTLSAEWRQLAERSTILGGSDSCS